MQKNPTSSISFLRVRIICIVGLMFPLSVLAEDVLKSHADFIAEHFKDGEANARMFILDENMQELARGILGHPYPALRIRYWYQDGKSLWILDEIGKVKPITTGIVIKDAEIVDVQILVYRESRGYEVKYPFFRQQFIGLELDDKQPLSNHIDNITGATLSVSAVTRLAHLALALHDKHVTWLVHQKETQDNVYKK